MIVERENLSAVLASAKMSPTTIPANGEKKRSDGESSACSDSALAKQQNPLTSSVPTTSSSHLVEREQPHASRAAAAGQNQQQQQHPSSLSVTPNASAHTYTYSGITNNVIFDQPQVYAHHAAAQSVDGGGSSAAAAGGGQYVRAPPYQHHRGDRVSSTLQPSSSLYYHHPTSTCIGGSNDHYQTTSLFHHGYPPERHPTAAPSAAATAVGAPDAIHRRYHHPNPTYPPLPSPHHQVSVPGPFLAPAPATTNLYLADEMAEIAAQSVKLRQIQRLEQEVVKRRRLLEADLTARYEKGARGRNSPTTSPSLAAAPGNYPPSSRPPTSSLYLSDGAPQRLTAGSGYGPSFPSPLRHHPRSLSAQVPHRHEHQHQHHQPPHFSPNPSPGEPMARSALPPPALGPAAGAGAAGSGMCPRASSGGSSAAGPAKSSPGGQVPIPSTSGLPHYTSAAGPAKSPPGVQVPIPSTSGLPHYTARHVIPLGLGHEDRNHLTEYLCLIRNEIIEIFPASAFDVSNDGNARGVVQEQVGMRCRFCAHRNRVERANRSTSYPSSVSRMYQSLTMMMREHLPSCPDIPPDVRERYNALKAGNTGSRTKESKRYWIASARSIGLVDTESGIRMTPPSAAPSVPAAQAPQT